MASVYSDASLAEKELNWKAERGLDEMCKLRFSIVEEVLGAITWYMVFINTWMPGKYCCTRPAHEKWSPQANTY